MKTGLQHAVLVFIVNILTTNEEKIKLIEIFNNLDQDGDGQLTKEDLKQGKIIKFDCNNLKKTTGFQKVLNRSTDDKEISQILEEVDTNNSGAIDYMGNF